MGVPELVVPALRCPGCGSTGFVRELEGHAVLVEWLFNCGACERSFRVELIARVGQEDALGQLVVRGVAMRVGLDLQDSYIEVRGTGNLVHGTGMEEEHIG